MNAAAFGYTPHEWLHTVALKGPAKNSNSYLRKPSMIGLIKHNDRATRVSDAADLWFRRDHGQIETSRPFVKAKPPGAFESNMPAWA